jgi:hypothetical protein
VLVSSVLTRTQTRTHDDRESNEGQVASVVGCTWEGFSPEDQFMRGGEIGQMGSALEADPQLLALMSGACSECVSLWHVLGESTPKVLSSSECARIMGFRNRYQLVRWLGKHRFPSFSRLVDWVRVLSLMLEWESGQTSLAQQAWASECEPSVCYRTVRRLCGAPWRSVRVQGFTVLAARFQAEVRESLLCRVGGPRVRSTLIHQPRGVPFR